MQTRVKKICEAGIVFSYVQMNNEICPFFELQTCVSVNSDLTLHTWDALTWHKICRKLNDFYVHCA